MAELRAYGNAISPQWAATIVATYLESEAAGHVDPAELARLELEDLLG